MKYFLNENAVRRLHLIGAKKKQTQNWHFS